MTDSMNTEGHLLKMKQHVKYARNAAGAAVAGTSTTTTTTTATAAAGTSAATTTTIAAAAAAAAVKTLLGALKNNVITSLTLDRGNCEIKLTAEKHLHNKIPKSKGSTVGGADGQKLLVLQLTQTCIWSNRQRVSLLSRHSRSCASVCPFVCLFVCLSVAKMQKTRFSQKLSNLKQRCLLTTYRKSHIGFLKNLLLHP